jgi:hypothetical protein
MINNFFQMESVHATPGQKAFHGHSEAATLHVKDI